MRNRTEINESSKNNNGYEMGYFKNDLFWLDESIKDELLLTSYVDSRIKLATLKYYLFYECDCDPSINTLNLETNLQRTTVDNLENYDYWQACLLAFEYIESSLKTLNYLNGKSLKEVKSYSHDIEELINLLPDNIQKELSIQCFWLPDEYLNVNYGPNIMSINENVGIREKLTQIGLEKGRNYFKKYLRRIHNGMVDIRYSDISELKKDTYLKFLLEMCKTLDNILEKQYEPVRHALDNTYDTVNNYYKMINSYNKGFILPTEQKQEVHVPSLSLSDEQLFNTKQSIDAKFKALKYYIVACNNYDFCTGNVDIANTIDIDSTMDEIIKESKLFRNDVSKKSGDGDVWKNYCYYQGCHLVSLYIEHALKYILLKSKNETYISLMQNYGHDFKKMYEYLLVDDQNIIRNNCMLLGDDYLSKAVSQKHTNDRIKNNDEIGTNNSLFDSILELMSDSFKQTRYPHSQNYNLEWKFSLRFMLKFADELNNLIQNKYDIKKEQTVSKKN